MTIFFARLADRKNAFTDVLRTLDRETVACVGRRLGYCNIYSPARPSLFYRLRMWRADDTIVAHRLARLAGRSTTSCFKYFALDGEPRKISEGSSVGACAFYRCARKPLSCVAPACTRLDGFLPLIYTFASAHVLQSQRPLCCILQVS